MKHGLLDYQYNSCKVILIWIFLGSKNQYKCFVRERLYSELIYYAKYILSLVLRPFRNNIPKNCVNGMQFKDLRLE